MSLNECIGNNVVMRNIGIMIRDKIIDFKKNVDLAIYWLPKLPELAHRFSKWGLQTLQVVKAMV